MTEQSEISLGFLVFRAFMVVVITVFALGVSESYAQDELVDILIRPEPADLSIELKWEAQVAEIGSVPTHVCLAEGNVQSLGDGVKKCAPGVYGEFLADSCIPVSALGAVVEGPVTVDLGEGDKCFHVVSIRQGIDSSLPSSRGFIVEDLIAGVIFLSAEKQ